MDSKGEHIPKIIHFCWFGNTEKPKIVKRCIESWKNCLPDYELKEWNEKTFDITRNSYINDAYSLKKYAFVSDYVRVHALYHYGGIYLDTDVEVFKPFEDLMHHDSFWGFEQENYIATSTIGAKRGNQLIKEFLDSYDGKNYIVEDGSQNNLTNVAVITKILENKGLKCNGQYQEMDGLGVFFPQSYFSPFDYINCRKFITEETYTMHYFYKSWLPISQRVKSNIKKLASLIIGGQNVYRIRKLFS